MQSQGQRKLKPLSLAGRKTFHTKGIRQTSARAAPNAKWLTDTNHRIGLGPIPNHKRLNHWIKSEAAIVPQYRDEASHLSSQPGENKLLEQFSSGPANVR